MSANVTLAGSQGSAFAADVTTRVATLQKPGGSVTNAGSDVIWIAEGQTTVATDGSDQNSIKIPSGGTWPLNSTTPSFAFRADAATATIEYKPQG